MSPLATAIAARDAARAEVTIAESRLREASDARDAARYRLGLAVAVAGEAQECEWRRLTIGVAR